ncbi:MAG: UDP-3-O-acyl-N-acetylglucosamine deacetylase [Armatimonadota bacterium]
MRGTLQRTIGRAVTIAGRGLHTGAEVRARLLPAPAASGVMFRRIDLDGAPTIPARLDEVAATGRGVVLGRRARVATVEHLLSAAQGVGIDNLLVEIDGEELPSGDGSARIFTDAFRQAGAVDLDAVRSPIVLDRPVWASAAGSIIMAGPAPRLRFTYVATADGTTLPPQLAEFDAGCDDYPTTIAPARTWGLAAEAEALRARGLALGATLENALVLGPDGYINEPRFPDELARHKILDALGDLSLLGRPLCAHVVAVRAGHGLHIALAREIAARLNGRGGEGAGGDAGS